MMIMMIIELVFGNNYLFYSYIQFFISFKNSYYILVYFIKYNNEINKFFILILLQ